MGAGVYAGLVQVPRHQVGEMTLTGSAFPLAIVAAPVAVGVALKLAGAAWPAVLVGSVAALPVVWFLFVFAPWTKWLS